MYKIKTIRVAYQKQENLKGCAPFDESHLIKINKQRREELSNFEKPVLDLSTIPKRVDLARN